MQEIELPQSCVWGVCAPEGNVVVIENVDHCGSEGDLTTSIARLSNGEEWLAGECKYLVSKPCGMEEAGMSSSASCMKCMSVLLGF